MARNKIVMNQEEGTYYFALSKSMTVEESKAFVDDFAEDIMGRTLKKKGEFSIELLICYHTISFAIKRVDGPYEARTVTYFEWDGGYDDDYYYLKYQKPELGDDEEYNKDVDLYSWCLEQYLKKED